MKYFLIGLIALFAVQANAQDARPEPPVVMPDTGIYYDSSRDGEGIVLIRNEDEIVFYFYTYHPDAGCWNSKDEDCHDQRWFVSSSEAIVRDSFVIGDLYTTLGVDYPDCADVVVPAVSPSDKPGNKTCARTILIGEFFLERSEDGWTLDVDQVDEFLDKTDPIYNTTYEFVTPLMYGTD